MGELVPLGVSVGVRGAHIGVTARGQRYTSVGLSGMGLQNVTRLMGDFHLGY